MRECGVQNVIGRKEIDRAIRLVGLDPDDKKKVSAFSLEKSFFNLTLARSA